ncbi:MAG TPA: PKD domain-containing protein [Chitinophagales bacterium]|nr:PKD domain-containing protein [Chitinophagales bacterium]
MKNIRIIFLFLCGAITTTGCHKNYPSTPPPPIPEFTFSGTINGDSMSLQAGVNDYYMFTSYSLDGNGVYDFTGEFRDKNCSSNCPNSLKIDFKDYRKYAILPTSIDTTIVPGYYSFATPAGTSTKFYVLFFDTLYNGTAQTYSWDFGDGTTFNDHNPIHLYYHPGVYNVSFSAEAASCSSSLNNDLVLGQAGSAFHSPFSESSSTGNLVHFTGYPGGIPPATWILDFGDGSITTGTNWNHTYSAPGVYAATLTVTDATGSTAISRVNAATETATTCYADFYPKDTITIANPWNFADVTVEWHDGAGNLYTSFDNSQPYNSLFKVISVEDYQDNISGQPTKKIHAVIYSTLYSGINSVVLMGDVVFSVAYL